MANGRLCAACLWKANSILVNAQGEKGFAYPQFSLVIEGKKKV